MEESIQMLTVVETPKEGDKEDAITTDLLIVDVSETDVAKAGDVITNGAAKDEEDVETVPLLNVAQTSGEKEQNDGEINDDVTSHIVKASDDVVNAGNDVAKAGTEDITKLQTKEKPAVKIKTSPAHPAPGQTINREPLPGEEQLQSCVTIVVLTLYNLLVQWCGKKGQGEVPAEPTSSCTDARKHFSEQTRKGIYDKILVPANNRVIQPIRRGVIEPLNRRVVQPLAAIDPRISLGNVVSIILAVISILFTIKALNYYDTPHESCSKCSFIGVYKEVTCLVISLLLLLLRWCPRHRHCPTLSNTFLAQYREVTSMVLALLGAGANFLSLMRWYIQEGSVAKWFSDKELEYVLEGGVRDIMILLLVAFSFNFMEFALMLLTQMGPKYKDLNPHLTASMSKHKVAIQVTP